MLITAEHLLILNELAAREAAGHPLYALAEDDPQGPAFRELELQGLVLLEVPRAYRLTYAGHEAVHFLVAMLEASLLPAPDSLEKNWRFLGSDVLAALQAAQQNGGHVGPVTAQALSARGLTERVLDALEESTSLHLNRHGEAWLDFARRYRARLEIDGDLAESIHRMHPGYTGSPGPHMPAEHLALLEAIDLLTWSVPERIVYALTALGQAVFEALRKGGYAALDESILEALALVIDRGSKALTDEQVADLQMLGYVELDGSVSAAGQAAMRAYALLQRESAEQLRSFAITEAEHELLATIQQLADPENTSQLRPDKKTLHLVLVDRMVKRYRDFTGRYGRMIKERSVRKRQALALLEQMKNHDEWFNTFWDLEELLVGLESFDLVRAAVEGAGTIYRLTPIGRRVLAEQEDPPRDISSTAVKVLTSAATRFRTPADPWVEQAEEEGLIGTAGVTRSGRLYASLAEHAVRIPALTRAEAEVLKNLPETVRERPTSGEGDLASLAEEKQEWALEKLEARGLIERLVDGGIVRTEAGQILAKAVSGAMHLGHPVTPTIVRLLLALRQVGTLYVKERKVRAQPLQWVKVERLTGLGPQEFRESVRVARAGQYIGEVHITEAGLDLLAVLEKLNSAHGLAGWEPERQQG
jgi:uncharacterized protein